MQQLQPATVTAVVGVYLQVSFTYRYTTWDQLCRPVLCGVTTGVHWMPQIGDSVWIAYLGGGMPVALCGLAALDSSDVARLPALLSGETAIYGATGNVLKMVQTGAVQAGNPSSTFKAVALNGDSITGTITAPSGGGACTFTLNVAASSTTLEGN